MAPSTPTTTPHSSATATNLAHPMSPTAMDILSKSFFRTWSERIILVVKTGAGKSHLMRTANGCIVGWGVPHCLCSHTIQESGINVNARP
eukprot:scaffold52473_cov33-Attheya_sp.AAC.1